MMIFTLAWRNVWRNPQRSFGLIISLLIGLLGLWILIGLVQGLNEQRLAERLDTSLAHLRITNPQFDKQKNNHDFLIFTPTLGTQLSKQNNLAQYTYRLSTWASVFKLKKTLRIELYGVNPSTESKVLQIPKYLIQGRYLETNTNKNEAVIGIELARHLHKKINDTLDIQLDNGKIISTTLVGIYEVSNKRFASTHIFIGYNTLLKSLNLPENSFHQLLIRLHDWQKSEKTKTSLSPLLPKAKVLSWVNISPDLAFLHLISTYFVWIFASLIALLLLFLQNILLQIIWQERLLEWERLRILGLLRVQIAKICLLEVAFWLFLALFFAIILGLGVSIYLSNYGINLGYFTNNISEIAFAKILYPKWFWYDAIILVSLFVGLPIASTFFKTLFLS